jgi:LmbE family N-acetylglucosaminyl deacetylase
MLAFSPNLPANATVLCLGAHCDDIEIGCGGTLLELRRRFVSLRIVWHVFSGGGGVREAETRSAAAKLMGEEASRAVVVHAFRGSYFPYCSAEIKEAFEALKLQVAPDLIFTHFLRDRHQDHRVISELTWNTFRDHAILEYEIPKYDGDLAQPHVYVPLSEASVELKVAALLESFPSQRSKPWFDGELFRGHMRLRGVECNASARHAEAFHGRKITL